MSGPLRFLAVHLPAFRLERCGYDADEVVGLIDELKNAMRLVALTPAARAAGLLPEMTAAAARARVPEVRIEERDPVGEYEDRCALVRAYTALSDRVAFPWEDTLVLEVSCVASVFGGEAGIAARAGELADVLGHRRAIAIADHPLAARALATWTDPDPPRIAPAGGAAPLLAPLPLAALDPSPAVADALRAVGVERIGQLAALEAASVAGRFGTEGALLHRVARGQAPPSADLAEAWGAFRDGRPAVGTRMGGATSTLQVRFALPGLLARLADRLAEQDLAVVRLQVIFRLEHRDRAGDDGRIAVPVRVGRPTRSLHVLEGLIRQRIEGVQLGAPIDELVLEVTEAARDQGWQPGLADRAEAREPLPDLLARLTDHLGEGACCGAELADAWRPEVAWTPRPWPPRRPGPPPLALLPPGAVPAAAWSEDPVEVQEAWEQALLRPRPALLLPEPAQLMVRCEAERPVQVHLPDRGWTTVDRAEGPERLQGEWWAPDRAWDRDYWVIRADGRTAWVFHDRARAAWALHGWFE